MGGMGRYEDSRDQMDRLTVNQSSLVLLPFARIEVVVKADSIALCF